MESYYTYLALTGAYLLVGVLIAFVFARYAEEPPEPGQIICMIVAWVPVLMVLIGSGVIYAAAGIIVWSTRLTHSGINKLIHLSRRGR